jgi:Flp pilus assembly protein TadD
MKKAIATFQKSLVPEGNSELWSGRGYAYAVAGKKADAQAVLSKLQNMSVTNCVAP